jgi:hypothetical protein
MTDRTITIPVANDTQNEGDEEFRVTLSNVAGGATLEGSATIDVEIDDNDAVVNPPPGGGGGGGGGAVDLLLLALLGLLWCAGAWRRGEIRLRAG